MPTPYVTPNHLQSLPLGVQWGQLSSGGTANAYTAQLQLCRTTTGWVDSYCGQVLRCTNDQESLYCPGQRAVTDNFGVTTIWPLRWPVLAISKLEGRPSFAQETDWVTFDATTYWTVPNAGVSELAAGDGTTEIQLSSSGMWRGAPDNYWRLRLTYTNGWPHGGLTSAVASGGTVLALDSVLGFTAGATPRIDDGYLSETVTVASVTVNADGVTGSLTLSAGVSNAHNPSTPVTQLPDVVVTATALYAAHLAMNSGTFALTVPAFDKNLGAETAQGVDFLTQAEVDLQPFLRRY